MFPLFRAVIDRIKAMLATAAALEGEADLLARDAERRAELFRLAERYAREGLHGTAVQLRRQAESLSLERPLAGVQPAPERGGGDAAAPAPLPSPAGEVPATAAALPPPSAGDTPDGVRQPAGGTRRKGR